MISADGFLDLYYAKNFRTARGFERPYATQATRQNESSVNLAHLGVKLEEEKFRGRVALQAGSAVTANSRAEANALHGHIQEAYAGFNITPGTWLDGGVYLGHIGKESWISARNMTYTRSLFLDFVPYYSLGLRLGHELSKKQNIEIHLMNGWQTISETNSGKAVGFQWKTQLGPATLTYNNYLGDENVLPGQRPRFRTYHNFIMERNLSNELKVAAAVDFGTQAQQVRKGTDGWGAFGVTLQKKLTHTLTSAVRLEAYSDPHQANVRTDTPNGFQVSSASANIDVRVTEKILWRIEARVFQSKDRIFSGQDELRRTDGFLVTSFSVSL